MALTRKDLAATILTALVVVVFAATHEGWNVWLVGGSHRWAAGAILLLGMVTCSLGRHDESVGPLWLAALGIAALALAVLALVTGSLTALSFLVLAVVALWAVSTARHVAHGRRARPFAA